MRADTLALSLQRAGFKIVEIHPQEDALMDGEIVLQNNLAIQVADEGYYVTRYDTVEGEMEEGTYFVVTYLTDTLHTVAEVDEALREVIPTCHDCGHLGGLIYRDRARTETSCRCYDCLTSAFDYGRKHIAEAWEHLDGTPITNAEAIVRDYELVKANE